MPIWEHKIAIIDIADREAQLDEFGRYGWDLVQLLPAGGRSWEAVFKREVAVERKETT